MTMAPAANMPDPLTPLERKLVEHVERGERLDLAGDDPVEEAAMRQWRADRTIRAWVVRDIARGRLAPDPDPHGLRLRGARIAGRVDLDNITSAVAIHLSNCILDKGLSARGSRLTDLALVRCWLEHPTRAGIDADGLVARSLAIHKTTVHANTTRGAVRLRSARIGGELDCVGATLTNDSGPALDATSLITDLDLFMNSGFSATGVGNMGAVCLLGAHIGGQMNCDGATLTNNSGPALEATSLTLDLDLFMNSGFSATGVGDEGTVRLLGAHIGGERTWPMRSAGWSPTGSPGWPRSPPG
jgi:hypothetical protein